MSKKLNILIATGIYPPSTSGPAQYAKNMKDCWEKQGNFVNVKTYTIENSLPTGARHLWYFIKIIPSVISSDFIFALDTFSVGFPAVLAAKIFNKKIILRTGGDFLWEGYVERTGDLVLLKDFYKTTRGTWTRKEKAIFKITGWTLRNTSALVFSTKWQKDIFEFPYSLANTHSLIVENRYGEKEDHKISANKIFIAGTRPLKWKNIPALAHVFDSQEIKNTGFSLDTRTATYDLFMEKMAKSFAVILVSLGDISPHMILDAIRLNKPFILTQENGLMDRIADIAITVNPKDPKDIEQKVLWLLEPNNYAAQVEKIKSFTFTHSWEQISQEIIAAYENLK